MHSNNNTNTILQKRNVLLYRQYYHHVPLDWKNKTYVMGILNITNDSFSGDGILDNQEADIIKRAQLFESYGADIIDIGAESTRPGSAPVSTSEELERLIPIIKAIGKVVDLPISVDTYKAKVAEEALISGANWVNDVWGLRLDPKMVDVVAEYNCPIIIMHNRSKPKYVEQEKELGGRFIGIEYDDLLSDIKLELIRSIDLALNKGVTKSNIIIDPGIGFGKTVHQNLQIINHLNEFKDLGYPILLGPSRKSFIGYTLNLPATDRLEGTSSAVVIGIMKGANIIRAHDVQEIVRISRMTDAILRS